MPALAPLLLLAALTAAMAQPAVRFAAESFAVGESERLFVSAVLSAAPSADTRLLCEPIGPSPLRVSANLSVSRAAWFLPRTIEVSWPAGRLEARPHARIVCSAPQPGGAAITGEFSLRLRPSAAACPHLVLSQYSLAAPRGRLGLFSSTHELQVRLGAPPSGPVTLSVRSDAPEVSVRPSEELVFRPGDWNVPQTPSILVAPLASSEARVLRLEVRSAPLDEPWLGYTLEVPIAADLSIEPEPLLSIERSAFLFARLGGDPERAPTLSLRCRWEDGLQAPFSLPLGRSAHYVLHPLFDASHEELLSLPRKLTCSAQLASGEFSATLTVEPLDAASHVVESPTRLLYLSERVRPALSLSGGAKGDEELWSVPPKDVLPSAPACLELLDAWRSDASLQALAPGEARLCSFALSETTLSSRRFLVFFFRGVASSLSVIPEALDLSTSSSPRALTLRAIPPSYGSLMVSPGDAEGDDSQVLEFTPEKSTVSWTPSAEQLERSLSRGALLLRSGSLALPLGSEIPVRRLAPLRLHCSVSSLRVPSSGSASYEIVLSRRPDSPLSVLLSGDGFVTTPRLLEIHPDEWKQAHRVLVRPRPQSSSSEREVYGFVLHSLSSFSSSSSSEGGDAAFSDPLLPVYIDLPPELSLASGAQALFFSGTPGEIVSYSLVSSSRDPVSDSLPVSAEPSLTVTCDCLSLTDVEVSRNHTMWSVRFRVPVEFVARSTPCALYHELSQPAQEEASWRPALLRTTLEVPLLARSLAAVDRILTLSPSDLTVRVGDSFSYRLTLLSTSEESSPLLLTYAPLSSTSPRPESLLPSVPVVLSFEATSAGEHSVVHSLPTGERATLSVHVRPLAVVELSSDQATLAPGSSGRYHVRLLSQPASDVEVLLTPSDRALRLEHRSLVFPRASWNDSLEVAFSVSASSHERLHIFHEVRSADPAFRGARAFPSLFGVRALSPVTDVVASPLSCSFRCSAGYAQSASSPFCSPCPVNSYCPGDCSEAKPCPSGQISNVLSSAVSACRSCPSGFYLPSGSTNCMVCPPGFRCAGGSDRTAVACPAGTYGSQGSCEACPKRSYSAVGASKCTACPVGSSCADAARAFACPLGTFLDEATDSCLTCPAGTSCLNPAHAPSTCPPGSYSPESAFYCLMCPETMICLRPDLAPQACPAGKRPDANKTICVSCPTGQFLQADKVTCSACPSGSICPLGSSGATSCPAGSYAKTAERCESCPSGTTSSSGATSCTACPAGKFCPSPAQAPQACPANFYSTGGSTDCSACLLGQQVNAGQTGCVAGTAKGFIYLSGLAPIACPAGTYTLSGVGGNVCLPCPAGSSCADPTADPVACPATKYSLGGATACLDCPAGYQCTNPALPEPCAYGQYGTGGVCVTCPAGSSCTSSSATACTAGFYSLSGDTMCHICPYGHSCASSSVAPVLCAANTFAYPGQTSCSACTVGSCPGGMPPTVPCPAGTFGASCTTCTAGFFCPDGVVMTACPSKTVSRPGQTECVPIPAAYFSTGSTWESLQPCAAGSYSTGSATACTPCTAGSICPFPDSAVVIPCRAGTYSPTLSNTRCLLCPAGFCCPSQSTVTPTACASGSFSGEGQVVCTSCPPGFACPTTYSQHPQSCPRGSYSAGGTASCTTCPENNYCSAVGVLGTCATLYGARYYAKTGSSDCLFCPLGFTCSPTDATPTPCTLGQFTTHASMACQTCPSGQYCPDPSESPLMCPSGTRSSGTGDSVCDPCPAGQSCTGLGVTTPVNCGAGCYSPGGNVTACLPCSPGFLCAAGSTTPDAAECPIGSYCAPPSQTTTDRCLDRVLCPIGTFGLRSKGTSQADACRRCPPGFLCTTAGTTAATMTVCPTGSYCLDGQRMLCPSGTYQPKTTQFSSDSCLFCPAGETSGAGAAACANCAAGYYCEFGKLPAPCPSGTFLGTAGAESIVECLVCPVGRYCHEVTTVPLSCPAGTYRREPGGYGLHSCLPCPRGTQCPNAGTVSATVAPLIVACTAGYFCPLGTALSTNFPCPAGTWSSSTSLTHSSQCSVCGAGSSCPEASTSATAQPCTAGYYCPAGTRHDREFPCKPGTWSSSTSLVSQAGCTACSAGKFCPGGGASEEVCPKGHYCPASSIGPTQFPCPAGTFQNVAGATSGTACQDCPLGHFCPLGSVDPLECPEGSYSDKIKTETYGPSRDRLSLPLACTLCPAGSTCAPASTTPTECPAATYSMPGAPSCTDCAAGYLCPAMGTTFEDMKANPCPAGYICPAKKSAVIDSMKCKAGFYCPESTKIEWPCAPGTYLDTVGGQSARDCKTTPAGFFTAGGASSYPDKCNTGHYCPAGSSSANSVPCPAGTYNPDVGSGTESACRACTAGSYCPLASAAPRACWKGYYCPLSSALPTPCPIGTFSTSETLTAATECTDCSLGKFCDRPGLTAPSGDCSPGFVCLRRSPTADPVNATYGFVCPKGGYCPTGSFESKPCAPGKYNNVTGAEKPADCIDCPPGSYCEGINNIKPTALCQKGYYCTGGAANNSQFPANPGHFSEEGAISDSPCPLGTYTDLFAQWECPPCPEGRYCDEVGTVTGKPCPSGYYCPEGSVMPLRCPRGTFASRSGSDLGVCEPCPGGMYCIGSYGGAGVDLTRPTGPCYEGYYCKSGSGYPNPQDSVTGDICPAGFYCPAQSEAGTPCPAGTFNPATGRSLLSHCMVCAGGSYCSGTNNTSPTGPCAEGFYCQSSAQTPRPAADPAHPEAGPCTIGHYCPQGTPEPIPCPPGSLTETTQQSVCAACPAGFYCPGDPLVLKLPCPEGHYCPSGTGLDYTPCPAGSFSNVQGLLRASDCTPCTAGFACPQPGMTAVGDRCEEGYYCGAGSTDTKGTLPGGSPRTCPPGFYCPKGSIVPSSCPLGTYSAVSGLTSATQCALCDLGFFCAELNATSPTGPCSGGYYCQRGNEVSTPTSTSTSPDGISLGGGKCPKGNYCPEGTSSPYMCPAGSYNDEEARSTCKDCPPGSFCLDAAVAPSGDCPAGYYCLVNTTTAQSYPCPAGKYNPDLRKTSLADCKPCDAGWYCDGSNPAAPTGKCRAGFYCSGGSKTATPTDGVTGNECNLGFLCPEGSGSQTACSAGKYCPPGDTEKPCSAGYYCIGMSFVPNPSDGVTGNICTAGHFCVSGETSPEPCPAGSYFPGKGNRNSTSCLPCTGGYSCPAPATVTPTTLCTAGFFCPPGTVTPTNKCTVGHYCPQGVAVEITCPPGSFQDAEGMPACKPCPMGLYCPEGAVTGLPCPKGHYCPPSTTFSTQYPCPRGTYNPSTSGQDLTGACLACPIGKRCPLVGLSDLTTFDCLAGYYCKLSVDTDRPDDNTMPLEPGGTGGNQCPAGFFCPEGTSTPQPCPAGTYLPSTGSTSAAVCLPCTPGLVCDAAGLASPSGLCPAGSFCPLGAAASLQATTIACPAGSFCPAGSAQPQKCLAGTLSDVGASVCLPCTAGSFCPLGSSPATKQACPAGYFCPAGTTHATVHPCPKGTYNPVTEGVSLATACLSCPEGLGCPRLAMTDPTAWPCAAGHYCKGGCDTVRPLNIPFADALTATALGGICPPGYYCPAKSTAPVACPLDSFSSSAGLTASLECLNCPPGFDCPLPATTKPSILCAEGFYCPNNATGNAAVSCPAGSFCPANSTVPQLCPVGSYAVTSGLKACTSCPAGFFCPAGTVDHTLNPCPAGFFCPAGTQFGAQFPCPMGTYSAATGLVSSAACLTCTAGHYCPVPGQSAAPDSTLRCREGFYCTAGSWLKAPLNETFGSVCPKGHFCEIGTSVPTPCPVGTYSLAIGNSAPSDCFPCPAGYVCNDPTGQVSFTDVICPAGFSCPQGTSVASAKCPVHFYCPAGSPVPLPCAPGRDQPLEQQATCTAPCPAGSFCLGGSPPEECPVGYYCPAGTSSGSEFTCPRGFFSLSAGLTSEAACTACTAGFYCPQSAMSSAPTLKCDAGYFCKTRVTRATPNDTSDYVGATSGGGLCPIGHFCVEGTSMPVRCPRGFFSISLGNKALADCLPCLAGSYCDSEGLDFPTMLCPAGSFCAGGNTGPTADTTVLTRPQPCATGHYCPLGSERSVPCQDGTFQDATGQASCKICPAGSFCDPASSAASACPQGFYCPAGTGSRGVAYSCPEGTFGATPSLSAEANCTKCPAGKYCRGTAQTAPMGDCTAGFICNSSAILPTPVDSVFGVGGLCPAGHYCLQGSATPTICSVGQYGPGVGYASAGECEVCLSGFQCTTGGLVTPTVLCPAGSFCPPLGPMETCPSEHYCLAGSRAPQVCPPGTHQPATGQTACVPCAAGSFCIGGVVSECLQGFFCVAGQALAFINPCPRGTLGAAKGLRSASECAPCPAGSFCGGAGGSTPSGSCQDGYNCVVNATLENDQAQLCPAGHYCVLGVKHECPAGTYGPFTGVTSLAGCLSCPPGYLCSRAALATLDLTDLCPAGSFCVGNVESPCPMYSYCPMGSGAALVCAPGTTTMAAGRSSCDSCPVGVYCESGAPVACPAGYYCPLGTRRRFQNPCPVGTYSSLAGREKVADCAPCPPGKYCARSGLSAPSGDCAAGFYCKGSVTLPAPTDDTVSAGRGGSYCPAGHFCFEGSSTPQPCPAGTFSLTLSAVSNATCLPCPAGYQCPTVGTGSTSLFVPCPAGFFCLGGATTPCPAGSLCVEGARRATPCPAGSYQPDAQKQACLTCPEGSFCEQGASAGVICPKGFYCPLGTTHGKHYACPQGTMSTLEGLKDTTECPPCPAGSYCSGTGLSVVTGACLAGFFCPEGSTMANPTASSCPQGHYCPAGSRTPVVCPRHTYSPNPLNRALKDCLACPPGTICPDEGTVDPTVCPSGFFCEGGKATPPTAQACLKGHFCPGGSAASVPCLAGTYQPETGKTSCVTCPEGKYCVSGSVDPVVCPAGFFCLEGTNHAHQYPCDVGTYSSATGLVSGGMCTSCPAGSFCAGYGQTTVSGPCQAGFLCIMASVTPTPKDGVSGALCPEGNFCLEGALTPMPCPEKTHSRAKGGLSQAQACLPCPDGYLCPEGTSTPTDLCPAGFFCVAGDQRSCTAKYYCPEGRGSPAVCPAGRSQPVAGRSACDFCPAGSFCNVDSLDPQVCPVGFFCPEGSSGPFDSPCPAGTFSNVTGLRREDECFKCPAGHYCSQPGLSAPSGECAKGYYCLEGASAPDPAPSASNGPCKGGCWCKAGSKTACPEACPVGFYCPEGAVDPQECDPGYHSPLAGASTCDPCPKGFHCPGGVAPQPCPKYHYCDGVANLVSGTVCPNGTYTESEGLDAATSCTPCPAGSYCTDGAETAPCSAGFICFSNSFVPQPDSRSGTEAASYRPCRPGFFCPEGNTDEVPCAENTFLAQTHGKSQQDCISCPNGYICEGTSAKLCDKGYYCSALWAASSLEYKRPCPPRTYNPMEGAKYNTSCLACPAGYFCNGTALPTLEGWECEEGSYCLVRERDPRLCPPGTYRSTVGASGPSACPMCPGGFFCPLGSVTPVACPGGEFCPAGSSSSEECPEGSFCPPGSPAPLPCTPGSYCPSRTAEPIVCTSGSYCPLSTAVPFVCPLGSYARNATSQNLTSVSEACIFCPPGTYGTALNRTECFPCTPGYACFGGTPTSHPTDADRDRGVHCPVGHFCPLGTAEPQPCPAGRYNGKAGSEMADDCLPCSRGYYNAKTGQSGCMICPSSTESGEGSSDCTCIGAFRTFNRGDGNCICQPGFEFFINFQKQDGDSTVDCQPIVYKRCDAGFVRSHIGTCLREEELCASECPEGVGGKYNTRVGFCECNQLPTVDLICNAECRASLPVTTINPSSGLIEIRNSTGDVQGTVNASLLTNSYGSYDCTIPSNQNTGRGCVLQTVQMSSLGFRGNYNPSAKLLQEANVTVATQMRSAAHASSESGLSERALQAEAASSDLLVDLPVLCLNLRDGVVFDFPDKSVYPIYMKDSLINTNPDFDAGEFRNLISVFRSNSSLSLFFFTFKAPGIYVFGTNTNAYNELVVSVQEEGALCPSEALTTRSTPTLIVLAVQPKSNLQLTTDWVVVAALLGFMLLTLALIIAGLYNIKSEIWKDSITKQIQYKKKAKQLQLDKTKDGETIVANVGRVAGVLVDETVQKGTEFDASRMVIDPKDVTDLTEAIVVHNQEMLAMVSQKEGLLQAVQDLLKHEMLSIKQVIQESTLTKKEGAQPAGGATDLQSLLLRLDEEEHTRHLYNQRLNLSEDRILGSLKSMEDFLLSSSNGQSVERILKEYQESAESGTPADASKLPPFLGTLEASIEEAQNQIRRAQGLVAEEDHRRAATLGLYDDLNGANLNPDILDVVNRLRDEGEAETGAGQEWSQTLRDYDEKLRILRGHLGDIHKKIQASYANGLATGDPNVVHRLEDAYRLLLGQFFDQLNGIKDGLNHAGLPDALLPAREEAVRGRGLKKLKELAKSRPLEDKRKLKTVELSLKVRGVDPDQLDKIHRDEKAQLAVELKQKEEEKVEKLKEMLQEVTAPVDLAPGLTLTEAETADSPSHRQGGGVVVREIDIEKRVISHEIGEGVSKEIRDRLFHDLDAEQENQRMAIDMERKKQEENMKNRLFEREQRKKKNMQKKQQEEVKRAFLLKQKEAQEKLVTLEEENERRRADRQLEEENQHIILEAAIAAQTESDPTELSRQVEEYEHALSKKRGKLCADHDHRLEAMRAQIARELAEEEAALRARFLKKKQEAIQAIEEQPALTAEQRPMKIAEAIARLNEEEEHELKELHVRHETREQEKVHQEEQNYDQQLRALKANHDMDYSRVLESLDLEHARQDKSLQDKLAKRKKANKARVQRELQAMRKNKMSEVTEELAEVEDTLKDILREENLEQALEEGKKKQKKQVTLSKEEEEELKAKENSQLQELQKRAEQELEEEQRLLLEEEQRALRELDERAAAELDRRAAAERERQAGQDVEALKREHSLQLRTYQQSIMEEHTKQKDALKTQMAAKREKRLMALRRKQQQDSERIKTEIDAEMEERLRPKRMELERRRIEKSVANGLIAEGRIGDAINLILRDRHDEELQRLLVRQYKEQVASLRDVSGEFSSKKLRRKLDSIQEWTKEGLSPSEMESRMDALDKELEVEWQRFEEDSLKDVRVRHEKELLDQNDQQLRERTALYQELVPAEHLEQVMKQTAKEIEEYQSELQVEKQHRIEALEAENRRKEEEIIRSKQEEMDQIERKYASQLETDRQEAERKLREQNERRKKEEESSFEEKKKAMQHYDADVHARILREHEEDLTRLESRVREEMADQTSKVQRKLQARKEHRLREIEKSKQREIAQELERQKRDMEIIQKKAREELRLREEQRQKIERAANTEVTNNLLRQAMKQRRRYIDNGRIETLTEADRARKLFTKNLLLTEEEETITPEIVKRVYTIERMLSQYKLGQLKQSERSKELTSYLAMPEKDVYRTEGSLAPAMDSDLDPEDRVILDYAQALLNRLFPSSSDDGAPMIRLFLAHRLPHNGYGSNPFKNRFFFNPSTNEIYIRYKCIHNLGEFLMLLLHVAAHLLVEDDNFSSETDPVFIQTYFKCLIMGYQDLFAGYYMNKLGVSQANAESNAPDLQQLLTGSPSIALRTRDLDLMTSEGGGASAVAALSRSGAESSPMGDMDFSGSDENASESDNELFMEEEEDINERLLKYPQIRENPALFSFLTDWK